MADLPEHRTISSFLRKEIVALVLLIAVAAVLFFVTKSAAREARHLREQDAAAWYALGQSHSSGGRLQEAVSALGRASAMARKRHEYRLAFAHALASAGQEEPARQVLLALREITPESPAVNARLARIEARRQDLSAAMRYYAHALHGSWTPEEIADRRDLHLEFVRYLLANDQRSRALAELLLLEASVPADPGVQTAVAASFLEAGDASRALDYFERALKVDPANAAALAGAGEAAFRMREYAAALRYLRAAPEDDRRVAELQPVVELVVSGDPLRARLTYRERQRRLMGALTHVLQRLAACLGRNPADRPAILAALQSEAQTLRSEVRRNVRPRSLNQIEDGVELVARIERELPSSCGAPSPYDRALLLIARLHETERT